MASLLFLAAAMLFALLFTSTALALAARWVGSVRGRLSIGLLVTLAITVFAIVFAAATRAIQLADPAQSIIAGVGVLLLQLLVVFLILKTAFRLSTPRAFAPLGAYIGAQVLVLIFMLFVVRPYLAEAFVMPTRSMAPTLNAGERFVVNKRLTPRRWDLVAYRHRDEQGEQIFCKRLVGLPGEKLRFEGPAIYINDQPQPAPPTMKGAFIGSLPRSVNRYRDGETIQLAADEMFLIGESLDISLDSRVEGPSKRDNLIGVADFRYWPMRRVGFMR